ncbi:hypothetical protein J3A83DRAFT_4342717 [Scleroderma citrinum]
MSTAHVRVGQSRTSSIAIGITLSLLTIMHRKHKLIDVSALSASRGGLFLNPSLLIFKLLICASPHYSMQYGRLNIYSTIASVIAI